MCSPTMPCVDITRLLSAPYQCSTQEETVQSTILPGTTAPVPPRRSWQLLQSWALPVTRSWSCGYVTEHRSRYLARLALLGDCCGSRQHAGRCETAGPAFQPYGFHGDVSDIGTWETNARAPVGCGGQSKPPLPSSDRDEQESLCAMFTALLLSDKPQNTARPCYDFKRNERLHMF